MKSEHGIGDMKWKGRKAERERGHSVLFLMRWSSDISALRGCADPLPVAAGSHPAVWRRQAEGRPADQCIHNINQPKEKGKSDHNVFMHVCVKRDVCFHDVEDLPSLLHASWWEVTWQTVPCDFSWDGAALRSNPPAKTPSELREYR